MYLNISLTLTGQDDIRRGKLSKRSSSPTFSLSKNVHKVLLAATESYSRNEYKHNRLKEVLDNCFALI